MSSPAPYISVIMPAYNHERYIGQAIESVLEQSFGTFEFIIVNDGSTDKTEEVIRHYDDKRIIYVRQDNADAFGALNHGLSLATGAYVAIINSDDRYGTDRLATLLECAQHRNAVLVFSGLDFIDESCRSLDAHPLISYHARLLHCLDEEPLHLTLLRGNPAITTSNFFFRRDFISVHGGFKPYRYAHDYDFLLRALSHFPEQIVYCPGSLLSYRIHTGNTVRENPARVQFETFRVLMDHLPMLMSCGKDRDSIAAAVEQLQQMEYIMQDSDTALQNVFSSVSWKITAPLRIAGEMLGVEPPGAASTWSRIRTFARRLVNRKRLPSDR